MALVPVPCRYYGNIQCLATAAWQRGPHLTAAEAEYFRHETSLAGPGFASDTQRLHAQHSQSCETRCISSPDKAM